MDLIDRYLAAIGALTLQGQRQDILAELRDALMSRCEEKEAETGRPLTEDEVADVLRGFGHPLVVAARYGGQSYLVGPELYPLYLFCLKILLAIVAAIAVVTGVVTAALHPGNPGAGIGAAIGAFIPAALANVGALTIIAAIVQRQKVRPGFLTNWNPRELPKRLQRPVFRPQTRLDNIAGIIAQGVFVLWWTRALAVWIPYVSYVPLKAGQQLDLARAPIWDTLFWPVLALMLASIAVHALKLFGQKFRMAAHGLDLARNLAALVVLWVALQAGHWVTVSGRGMAADALAKVDYGVNLGLQIGLVVLTVVAVSLVLYDSWRLFRDQPRRLAPKPD
ncbi:MAG TPA: hypothetical protein VGL73_02045 [Caulobacteraceae bacterium]|jgi:hypothetical protein